MPELKFRHVVERFRRLPMDTLRQDLLFAVRLLQKDRAYAAAVILTLAICLGANAAIFTVVRSVLLRPLPYVQSDRLAFTFDGFPGAGVERAGTSVPNYMDRVALRDAFDAVALFQTGGFRVGRGTGAEGLASMSVTPSFFRVLRTTPTRGRFFLDEEGTVGREKVVVLSHAFASRQDGGIGAVIGRELLLNDEKHVVVGVTPAEFVFRDPDIRLWVPLAFSPEQMAESSRYSQNHDMIARLADGATLQQAQARLDALTSVNVERAGAMKQALLNAGYHTRIVGYADDIVRDVRAPLQLLWGGVLFVVLIAAVNVANLSLVRASGRLRELATRNALGAGRTRVARQLITEALLLTVVGGSLGVLVGVWSLDALATLGLSDVPRAHEIRLDGIVLAFTFGLAVVLGLAIGVSPAVQLARINLSTVLREDSRTGTAGRRARYVRRTLVVSQVALAFVLLIGGGLLLASFQRLLAVSPGFTPEHVLTGRVSPLTSGYPDDAALRSYTNRALARMRALPGVEAAGVSSYLPFSWDSSSSVIIAEGYTPAPGESVVSPNQLYVTPGYLEALKVSLKRGRFFAESDTAESAPVVLVDERLAAKFWPNADPIGRRMYLPDRPEDVVTPGPTTKYLQVIGVVGAVKLKGLIEGENARAGAYYLAYAQSPSRNVGFAIRTQRDAPTTTAAVQRALTEIDPELQAFDVFSMSERVDKSLNPRRAPMVLSLAFGLVALLLASVGLYGVLAFQVSQRTREIGIRMALGSDTGGILRMVLGEGALLVVVGLGAGLAGSLVLRGVIASHLYGVGAFDPGVVLAAIGVLGVTSLVACLGPARRAAQVNPIVALSQQ